MKSHQVQALHFLISFISHPDPPLSPLNNFSVNALNQLPWQSRYTVGSFTPTTLTYLTTIDVSLSLWFSSPPPSQPDRSGWVRRAEVLLSSGWDAVKALCGAGCEEHTSEQWKPVCSYGALLVSADSAWPVHGSCPSKAAPRAVCSEPNPACQISLQVTWLLLSPQTHVTFTAISLCLMMFPFLKSVSTRMQVYRHSNSHVKYHRQTDVRKTRKLRNIDPQR